jgi:hypothetical protein
MSKENGRMHRYFAEATALEGDIQLPVARAIKPLAFARLPEQGGYVIQRAEDFRLEGIISFRSAYAQVAGNLDTKPGHGWSTLTTSVVEGLNVLDVVTADRVVGQLATEHPLAGYVPHVTLLGTRFENLRIAGHPVKLDLDLDIFGNKPENDAPYSKEPGFLDRVARQHAAVSEHPSLLDELRGRYTGRASIPQNPTAVECSLVNGADGSFPGQSCGHVIHVPYFGTIVLAALRLEQEAFDAETGVPRKTTFHLKMIELKMGCIGKGNVTVGNNVSNGGDIG